MNKERRERLDAARKVITDALEDFRQHAAALRGEIEAARDAVGAIGDDESEAHGNMPEGLQQSERGQTMEANAEAMEQAVSDLDGALDAIDEACDQIEQAESDLEANVE